MERESFRTPLFRTDLSVEITQMEITRGKILDSQGARNLPQPAFLQCKGFKKSRQLPVEREQ